MLVCIDRSVVSVVLQFVMGVLKIADKHNGMCVGKFAYDVLSKIRNKRYNNVLFNDTVTIMFTHENGVTQFLKECTDTNVMMTTDDMKHVIIDRNGSYIIDVELVVGAPQLTFQNHDCRFDMSSMTVVHNKWPAANFACMIRDNEYQYADGYKYQSLSMSDIWILIQQYPNAKFYDGRQLLFARQIPPSLTSDMALNMVVSDDGSFYYNNSIFTTPSPPPSPSTTSPPSTTPLTSSSSSTTPPSSSSSSTTPLTSSTVNWDNLQMVHELVTSMLHFNTVCDRPDGSMNDVRDRVCNAMYSEVCELLLPTTN